MNLSKWQWCSIHLIISFLLLPSQVQCFQPLPLPLQPSTTTSPCEKTVTPSSPVHVSKPSIRFQSSSRIILFSAFRPRVRIWESKDVDFILKQKKERQPRPPRQPREPRQPRTQRVSQQSTSINGDNANLDAVDTVNSNNDDNNDCNNDNNDCNNDNDDDDDENNQSQKPNETRSSESELSASESKYLIQKYENRATIMENVFQTKMQELKTMTRRVEILQDVVKQLKDRQTTLVEEKEQLTQNLQQSTMNLDKLASEKEQIQWKFQNQTVLLQQQLALEQSKCMDLEKACQNLTSELNLQTQLMLEKEESWMLQNKEMMVLVNATAQSQLNNNNNNNNNKNDNSSSEEIVELNKKLESVSQQLQQLQKVFSSDETWTNDTNLPQPLLETIDSTSLESVPKTNVSSSSIASSLPTTTNTSNISTNATTTTTTLTNDTTPSTTTATASKETTTTFDQTSMEIALAAVRASEERERKLQNRVRIIQHELQSLLAEKDDLEQARNTAMETQTKLEAELLQSHKKYKDMEQSYLAQMANLKLQLQQSKQDVTTLEQESNDWKEQLLQERQRNRLERNKEQVSLDDVKEIILPSSELEEQLNQTSLLSSSSSSSSTATATATATATETTPKSEEFSTHATNEISSIVSTIEKKMILDDVQEKQSDKTVTMKLKSTESQVRNFESLTRKGKLSRLWKRISSPFRSKKVKS